MEEKLVSPASLIFYICYVDDTFVRRKKNLENKLFKVLNTFHRIIKLTLEENPTKFLDTHLTSRKNGSYFFQVVNKSSKLPFHFSSQIPLQYKRSVITGELHRAKAIGSDFDHEKDRITAKFSRAGYPCKFLMSQFKKFELLKEELLIMPGFFDKRANVHVKITFFPKNEREIRKFLDKLESYTNFNIRISYSWLTSKIRTLPYQEQIDESPPCNLQKGMLMQ